MTIAVPSTTLAAIQPAFTDPGRLALAGYLAGYHGLTRDACTLGLRQFTTWCRARSLNLLAVRRADIESFARELEARGRARNELGALLVAAGLGPPAEHALISLLALNGLRVSEATGADIEHLGLERGHRTLTITRRGGKVVTIPLAPRTARASVPGVNRLPGFGWSVRLAA